MPTHQPGPGRCGRARGHVDGPGAAGLGGLRPAAAHRLARLLAQQRLERANVLGRAAERHRQALRQVCIGRLAASVPQSPAQHLALQSAAGRGALLSFVVAGARAAP